jgi:hypothetical protein
MAKNKDKSTFPTLASIASQFGMHRNTVSGWFSSPNAPKKGPQGYDFDQVTAWVHECAGRENTLAKVSPEFGAAKLAEILERVRRLKLANDAREKTLILRSEFERELREMADAVTGVLTQGPQRLAPVVAGLSAIEVERHLVAWIDEAIGKLSRGESK